MTTLLNEISASMIVGIELLYMHAKMCFKNVFIFLDFLFTSNQVSNFMKPEIIEGPDETYKIKNLR